MVSVVAVHPSKGLAEEDILAQLMALYSTCVKPLSFWKALSPIEVTELGMVNVPVRLVQPTKAQPPIVVTELPRLKLVKPLQKPNAPKPMVVTEFGMVRLPVHAT